MYTYLALGDSYTIGELVASRENFPHQLVALMKQDQFDIADPVIIATTGWTTDELAASIREHNIHETFSFVTLLIGVNNQYRGRDVDDYKKEFTNLLNQAILFANGHARHVFVLSIPDWGVTPFAEGKDRAKIAQEIDAYNNACKEITLANKCHMHHRRLFCSFCQMHNCGIKYLLGKADKLFCAFQHQFLKGRCRKQRKIGKTRHPNLSTSCPPHCLKNNAGDDVLKTL
ncbi:hypothetical protein OSTOST_07089 [Ostertagia ostertagi]